MSTPISTKVRAGTASTNSRKADPPSGPARWTAGLTWARQWLPSPVIRVMIIFDSSDNLTDDPGLADCLALPGSRNHLHPRRSV